MRIKLLEVSKIANRICNASFVFIYYKLAVEIAREVGSALKSVVG